MISGIAESLQAGADGSVPPNVALVRLFIAAHDENEARTALHRTIEFGEAGTPAWQRLNTVLRLWDESPGAFAIVKKMNALAVVGSARWRSTFDEAARICPEAAVAMYSLGNAHLLEAITRELVARMQDWDLLKARERVLDLGCGSGRVAAAIAPLVCRVVATDVSFEMTRLARKKTEACDRVTVLQVDGGDIAYISNKSIDLVLAIDSFPYVVQLGRAATHISEAARVLRPGGHLLMINYSYRGDLERDRHEVSLLAFENGLAVLRNGTTDLSLWDGQAFLLAQGESHGARVPNCA